MYSNQKNNLAIVRSRENYCEKLVKELTTNFVIIQWIE
jgi:hypothetical protein